MPLRKLANINPGIQGQVLTVRRMTSINRRMTSINPRMQGQVLTLE